MYMVAFRYPIVSTFQDTWYTHNETTEQVYWAEVGCSCHDTPVKASGMAAWLVLIVKSGGSNTWLFNSQEGKCAPFAL